MRYDLTSLDIFIAAAEERNLTRAARNHHLAVSAVSKRISELEEQVGSALLVRYARGVELTPAGQSLLFYARQVRKTLQSLDNELSDFASGIKGHIRIHSITSALSQFLPQDISRFASLYPQIRFDIEEQLGSAVVRAVADGRADVGIVAAQTSVDGLETARYREDHLTVVLAATHALANRSSLTWSEVLEHELVGPHRESSVYALLSKEAEALGKSLNLRIRISSFDCICRMVSEGMGLAVLPLTVVRQYQRSHHLSAVTLAEPWAERGMQLIFRKCENLSPTVRTFIDNLSHGVA